MQAGHRVTVFGGSGFIGRYVVKRLAQQGCVVRVCVRDTIAAAFLKPMGNVGQVVPMHLPITSDDAALRVAVEGADAVINLVGILAESRKGDFDAIHAAAPARLAKIAAEAGVAKFVHVSALGASPESKSSYARSKAAGEAGIRAAFPNAIFFRPSIVIGPEDGFFNRFAQLANWLPGLPLIGGGETRFQPVYVGDLADGIVAALDKPEAAGKTYEAVGPTAYTFRQLMEYMLDVTAKHRGLIPIAWPIAELQAAILELLPIKLLTRDQVTLLRSDNVATGAPALEALGVKPHAMEAVAPTWLAAYRKGGRFATKNA